MQKPFRRVLCPCLSPGSLSSGNIFWRFDFRKKLRREFRLYVTHGPVLQSCCQCAAPFSRRGEHQGDIMAEHTKHADNSKLSQNQHAHSGVARHSCRECVTSSQSSSYSSLSFSLFLSLLFHRRRRYPLFFSSPSLARLPPSLDSPTDTIVCQAVQSHLHVYRIRYQ